MPRGGRLRQSRSGLVDGARRRPPVFGDVLPGMETCAGCAVRVPTASVSAVDLTVVLGQDVSAEVLKALAQPRPGLIGATDRPLVSQDLRAAREFVLATPEMYQCRAA